MSAFYSSASVYPSFGSSYTISLFLASFGVAVSVRGSCGDFASPYTPYLLLPPPLRLSDAVDLMRVSGTSTAALSE